MLATALVNRQTTASRLIDDGFNRLSTFHKDGLPTWFLDDESKYYKPNIPITKEAINALREKQRALDARPIKKIAEAKARKKFKAVQRVEKAKRKADGVMEADDLNMTEKARQIGKVIGRAKGREKRVDKKVVVAKGANKGVKGRPRGVKGRYKIVDARMRKEVRLARAWVNADCTDESDRFERTSASKRPIRSDDLYSSYAFKSRQRIILLLPKKSSRSH